MEQSRPEPHPTTEIGNPLMTSYGLRPDALASQQGDGDVPCSEKLGRQVRRGMTR